MPQIVEYVNREGITPTDRGTEARVQQGRRIGASFNQVAESLRNFGNRAGQELGGAIRDAGDAAASYAAHREIGQGISSYALLQDSLVSQWNDISKNADPNDPTVRQRFLENSLGPQLEKWGDSFNTDIGQNWARGRTSALLDHFYEKTAADMGTLAAQAVDNNVRTVGNTYQSTAYKDPSMVNHLLEQTDASIGGLVDSSPNLKGVAAGKAKIEIAERQKEAIVKSGAFGAISKSRNPEATADDWVRRYPQYITGAEAKSFAAQARQEIRARNYDFETNRRRDREIAQDKSTEAAAQYEIDLRSRDPKLANDPTATTILHDPALTKTDRKHLLDYIDRQAKPETDARVSAQSFRGFMRELGEPDSDPVTLTDRAWNAYTKGEPGQSGSLSYPDLLRFRKEVEDRKTPEGMDLAKDRDDFLKRYASTIDPDFARTGLHTSLGDQAMYLAEKDAMRQERNMKAAHKDPHELYDPRSANFLGNPKSLDKYRQQNTLQEQLKAGARNAAQPTYIKPPPFVPMVTPPVKGEKPATFEERFGFPSNPTGVTPYRVRQLGHTYERQPDGSMKEVASPE